MNASWESLFGSPSEWWVHLFICFAVTSIRCAQYGIIMGSFIILGDTHKQPIHGNRELIEAELQPILRNDQSFSALCHKSQRKN